MIASPGEGEANPSPVEVLYGDEGKFLSQEEKVKTVAEENSGEDRGGSEVRAHGGGGHNPSRPPGRLPRAGIHGFPDTRIVEGEVGHTHEDLFNQAGEIAAGSSDGQDAGLGAGSSRAAHIGPESFLVGMKAADAEPADQ